MAAAIQPKKGRPKAVINPDSCSGCEVCIAVCPVDCIDKLPGPELPSLNATCVIDQPRCIGCFLCEKICPWEAITMVPPQEVPLPAQHSADLSVGWQAGAFSPQTG